MMRPNFGMSHQLLILSMLLAALGLASCKRPEDSRAATLSHSQKAQKDKANLPIIIGDDRVTMSSDHILTIKPSRYQPSLGLQGLVEPIKQTKFSAAQELIIDQVLVKKGQHIEKNTPLFIVHLPQKSVNEIENSPGDETARVSDTNNESDASDHKNNNLDSNDNNNAPNVALLSAQSSTPIVIKASYSGQVADIFVNDNDQINAKKPLLQMGDDRDLRFVATLPIEAKPQLSVGQTVNFTADHLTDTFSGQISKLQDGSKPNELLVVVHVINNDISRAKLRPNMMAAGRVDYGQIEVGTIVPVEGIHDVDLSALQKPPYKPLSPLPANVWIIKQDQRLTRQPVEVIEFDPSTKQYLVAGISNDSLICLANLPIESAGKKVIVS